MNKLLNWKDTKPMQANEDLSKILTIPKTIINKWQRLVDM